MKYKLITSKSLEDFNREVTQVMNDGWNPFGTPIITRMESSNKMIYSQGVIFGYHTSKDVMKINTREDLNKLNNCDFWISNDKDTVIDLADTNSDIFRSKVTEALEQDLATFGPLYAIIKYVHDEEAVKSDANPIPAKEKK